MPRASTISDAFNAIAEPRRRQILEFIAADERSVGEIADELELGQPSVSKHLQVLLNVDLVTMRRDGRRTLYRTNAETLTHDPRLERDVCPALAWAAPAHQGTRGGETMSTTASALENSDLHHHGRHRRARVHRADVQVARRADRTPQRDAATALRCRWSSRHTRAAAGIATSVATTDISGVSCRASSARRCSRSGGRCSCPQVRPRT